MSRGALTLGELLVSIGTFGDQEPSYKNRGRARYSFYDTAAGMRIDWSFSTAHRASQQEWRDLGRSPVVWHYIPPTLRHPPIILFVVDRHVWIRERITHKGRKLRDKLARLSDQYFSSYNLTGAPRPVRHHRKPRRRRGYGLQYLRSLEDGFQQRLNLWNKKVTSSKPQLIIHRVQHRSLLPDSDAVHWLRECGAYSVLHTPRNTAKPVELTGKTAKQQRSAAEKILRRSGSQAKRITLPFGGSKRSAYIVRSDGRGVQIRNVDGEYDIRLQVDDLYKPAAFSFEFGLTTNKKDAISDQLALKVHYNDNVRFKVDFDASILKLDVTIWSKKETQTRAVIPSLGQAIEPLTAKGWKQRGLKDFGPSTAEIAFRIASLGLVFLPFGPLIALALDLAEIAYTYHHGEDFFGNQVPPLELGLMGLGVALDVATGAVRVVRSASRSLDISDEASAAMRTAFGQLDHEYQNAAAGTLQAVDAAAQHPLVQLIASLPKNQQQKAIKILNSRATPKKQWELLGPLLQQRLESLAKDPKNPILRRLVHSTLQELVTSNGQSFKDALLHIAYQKYLKRTRKNPKAAKNPFDWLARTQAAEPVALLRQMLGENYQKLIKTAIQKPRKARRTATLVTVENVGATFADFDKIAAQGLQKYSVLRKFWEQLDEHVRDLFLDGFQLEHALEQRFLRNIGRNLKSYEFDALNHLMTTIVPRNQRVAHAMFSHPRAPAGVGKIAYTQTEKTRLAAERIPHGTEHLFDAQEIADMTAEVLMKLDADTTFPLQQLYGDVMVLASSKNATRVPVIPLRRSELPKHGFDTSKGWPKIGRDKQGKPVILNLPEVIAARAARAKKAEEIAKAQVQSGRRPDFSGPDGNGQFSARHSDDG